MQSDFSSRSWFLRGVAGAVLLLPAACAQPSAVSTAAAAATPVPAGAARIWFYREYEPSVSLNYANVALNGAQVATVAPDGSAFHRDVAPGHYHVSVDSVGQDVNQAKDIDLAPGQEAFVKILALRGWDSGGDTTQFDRDTFYVSVVPPQVARAELVSHPLTGG
ncbi:MAG TPA: hypothetical protein VHY35_05025 [Stellaceae bacterium]|jgi:hypothetical protein|nr:hypothetical protein [Stellaceae bacterium]